MGRNKFADVQENQVAHSRAPPRAVFRLRKARALKANYKGYWSRRIADEHRLIYKVTDDEILVASCKGYYE